MNMKIKNLIIAAFAFVALAACQEKEPELGPAGILADKTNVEFEAGGPDPNSNSKLKDCIAKAKAANVPNDNIERIIKKAAAVFVRLADKMNSLYIVTGHALRPCTVCFRFIPEDDRKRRRQICVRLPNLEALR